MLQHCPGSLWAPSRCHRCCFEPWMLPWWAAKGANPLAKRVAH